MIYTGIENIHSYFKNPKKVEVIKMSRMVESLFKNVHSSYICNAFISWLVLSIGSEANEQV